MDTQQHKQSQYRQLAKQENFIQNISDHQRCHYVTLNEDNLHQYGHSLGIDIKVDTERA